MIRISLLGWAAALVLISTALRSVGDDAAGPTPLEVFEQRIMPIFKSPRPASCVQCHLAAVDLKDYIRPSHQQTFVSLRDQGLIDLAHPEQSKILTLIQMGEKDLDKGARLIHEPARKAEYAAFAAWIKACCNDPELRNLPPLPAADMARPDRPDEVIRHARKSRVVDSFVRSIWSQRMRCFPCHTPHERDESNPRLAPAIAKHKKFLEKYPQFAVRMNLFRETPEATMQALIEKSRKPRPGELPLINLAQPQKSLLVLKPTSKLPPKNDQGEFAPSRYAEPVSHMGGLKMHVDDQSYKSFLTWIQDYARVVGDRYTSVGDLPADNWFPSKHVIFLRQAPGVWPVGTRVQLFIHPWNDRSNDWQPRPVAFTQGTVTPIHNVVGTLFVFGPSLEESAVRPDPENARLAPGKYLLKAYVDAHQRLAHDPTLLLGADDYFGQLELNAKWGEGFRNPEKLSGKLLKRP